MGRVLVIIAGLVVLGVGLYSIYHGATKGFQEDLEAGAGSGSVGTAIIGEQPFGPVLLIIIGIGLALYGLYSIARARNVEMQLALLVRAVDEQPAVLVQFAEVVGLPQVRFGEDLLRRATGDDAS